MSYQHFKQSDRDEISILLKKGYSHRDIARAIGKNHSSVSREIKTNSARDAYDPRKAQTKARLKRRMSKYQGMKIVDNPNLEIKVAVGLMANWSPEEVAGRIAYLNNGQAVISAKSVYKFCYSSRGQYLCKYLPHQRYHPKKRQTIKIAKTIIPNRVFIDFRPDIVAEQKRFGDFEGDTLGRPKYEQETFVGAVERKSLFLPGLKAARLKYSMDGLKDVLSPHQKIVKSMTLDNGVENAKYEKLNVETFFCHPYSSWEKPIIENTFGRLRRFIPKRASLANYSQEQISAIIEMMNNTPRKKLGYKTPKEVFNELYTKSTKLPSVALEGKG
ncbi:IS30 family transposase [Patescibacteria group bacterium]|nr:IS30 family transposase [Patescibacteria group bacterium]